MVKVKSSVGIIKGKAGNMSYFEVNGETIGRSFHTSIKNPKTMVRLLVARFIQALRTPRQRRR